MDERPDDELITKYREGDGAAFEALFQRHHVSVYNFALNMLGDASAAEDICQDTFVAAARAAVRYEPRGRLRVWLLRIARNRCLNHFESERARKQVGGAGDRGLLAARSADPTPAENVEESERLAMVHAGISKLPERQREAILLYAFEDMRYREIAQVLDMPVNTVKTLLHRGRAALAEMLGEFLEDGNDVL